jgi:heavy metal sensor kinase
MNRPRSLRVRAMTWYGTWMLVLFAVTALLVLAGFQHHLERTLATTQRARALRIAGVALRTLESGRGDLNEVITLSFAPEATDRFISIADRQGRLLYHSGAPQDQSFDPLLIPSDINEPGTRTISGVGPSDLLLTTVESSSGGRLVRVSTGSSLGAVGEEQRRFMITLGFGFAIIGAVAFAGGFMLVDRALKPIGELTRSAELITSRNLSERLPEPATEDEFAELSRSLNRMIARLDEAFQYNRRFLDDASHELRTPLTVLRGELEALNRESTHGRFRDSVASLLDEVERLAKLVENLFALSRLDAGRIHTEWTPLDLSFLASSTAEQMRLLAEDKGLKLSCDSAVHLMVREGVWIEGDRARLKQVIVNLLDNAFKYTPAGGSVSIQVRGTETEAVLEVRDTGIGIPASALPRVFERFFRVDASRNREGGGSGIGLSIVRSICAVHRGRVEVESVEGRGSCFRVYLPRVSKETAPSSDFSPSTPT